MASVSSLQSCFLTPLDPPSRSLFAIMAPRGMTPVVVPLTLDHHQPRPQFPNQGYLPNATASGPTPGAQALLPNNGRIIQSGPIRVLCVADVRGELNGVFCRTSLSDTLDLQEISSL